MITYLSGRLIEKNPTYVVIDCGGVGYYANISLHSYALLPQEEHIKLFTHLQVKEDSHTLYGFMQRMEREIFRLLISVSGIGASTARTMLSSLDPDQIKNAIASGDVVTIQSIKGIGAKTAQRVILDLKDKIIKVFDVEVETASQRNTNKEEALSALETLGFNRKLADKVCIAILKDNPEASVETIIKEALKKM